MSSVHRPRCVAPPWSTFSNYWKSVLSHVFSPLSLFTECDMKNKMVVTASLLSLFVQWETVNKKLIGWTWNPLVPGYWLSTPRHHRSVCFSCMQGLIVQSKQSLILKKKVGTLLICLRNWNWVAKLRKLLQPSYAKSNCKQHNNWVVKCYKLICIWAIN